MKYIFSHALSIMLVLFMALLTLATSQTEPSFKNSISIEYDDLYLYIKIKTNSDPNYYNINDNIIEIFFDNMNEHQVLQNFIDDNGNNLSRSVITGNVTSRSVIADYEKEPIILSEGEFVFENFVENDKFVVKI